MSEVRSTDDGVEYTPSRPAVNTSDPSASPGALCERVEIEATKNGGFTARKYYASTPEAGPAEPSGKSPETYAFSSFPEVATFLGDAFGAGDPMAPPAAPASDVESATPDHPYDNA